MDSLPTGSMQSWVIVASASVSPMVILFVVDATGRLFRKGKQVGREQRPQGWNEVDELSVLATQNCVGSGVSAGNVTASPIPT